MLGDKEAPTNIINIRCLHDILFVYDHQELMVKCGIFLCKLGMSFTFEIFSKDLVIPHLHNNEKFLKTISTHFWNKDMKEKLERQLVKGSKNKSLRKDIEDKSS